MKGRVALLGATGMLGRAMRGSLASRGARVEVVGRDRVDLAKPDSIAGGITPDVTLVINCAAYTDVDGAEREPERAQAINGRGVGALAARCREIGATLVTYGTDYVFDGRGTRPYPVDHPLSPINAYGRSKAAGERALGESGVRHLLIRTSWLYAPWGDNFVLTMARLTRERETLRVVDDQRGRPTSSLHLAEATLALVERGVEGPIHVTDGGECTWYELACAVRDHSRHACDITPCTSDDFPRPAARPSYSVLDIGPAEALLGPMPHYREAVARALDAHSSGATS